MSPSGPLGHRALNASVLHLGRLQQHRTLELWYTDTRTHAFVWNLWHRSCLLATYTCNTHVQLLLAKCSTSVAPQMCPPLPTRRCISLETHIAWQHSFREICSAEARRGRIASSRHHTATHKSRLVKLNSCSAMLLALRQLKIISNEPCSAC